MPHYATRNTTVDSCMLFVKSVTDRLATSFWWDYRMASFAWTPPLRVRITAALRVERLGSLPVGFYRFYRSKKQKIRNCCEFVLPSFILEPFVCRRISFAASVKQPILRSRSRGQSGERNEEKSQITYRSAEWKNNNTIEAEPRSRRVGVTPGAESTCI